MIQQMFDIPSTTSPPPPTPPVATHPFATPVEIDLLTPDEPFVRKMMATYSADVIAYGNKARGYVEHSDRLWVCTSHGGMQIVDLTEIHPGHIDIPRTPNNPRLYYAGWKITIKGKPFTLGAAKLHVRYKPPEETPDAICVIDKCTMEELARHYNGGIFEGKSHAFPLTMLGREWIFYQADLDLAVHAVLHLVQVAFTGLDVDVKAQIPPEQLAAHEWVGMEFRVGAGTKATVLPHKMTVICPATFKEIRAAWLKELNYIPPADNFGAGGEEDEEPEDGDIAEAPPNPKPTKRPDAASGEFIQHTIF